MSVRRDISPKVTPSLGRSMPPLNPRAHPSHFPNSISVGSVVLALLMVVSNIQQCCCPWPWSLALRCPQGQILSPWPSSWPWGLSPWPWLVGQPVNLIFHGTSEPQKPWHVIACFISLIALSLFIAWTCATVELLILSFCVLSHP